MKINYLFFLFGLIALVAAKLACLSHPLTNFAIATPLLSDSLPRASARRLAIRTSFFNPCTCFFKVLIISSRALILGLPAAFFAAAGRFFTLGFTAFFLQQPELPFS